VFFQAMHDFHVALVGVGGRWYARVLAVAEGSGKIGLELTAIVGLPDQVARRAAVAIQMPLDTDGKDRAGRSAALLGEGPERQAAANFHKCRYSTARSRLQPRQPESKQATQVDADLIDVPLFCLRILAYNLVNLNPQQQLKLMCEVIRAPSNKRAASAAARPAANSAESRDPWGRRRSAERHCALICARSCFRL
jgi:hypothetical protein